MSEGRRKHIPLRAKLEVALRHLGYRIEQVRWDHDPALELRPMNEDGTDTIPPASDPAYIQLLVPEEHDRKTFGTKATSAGSDIHKIAKHRRITASQEEFRRTLLAKAGQGEPPPRKKRRFGR